MFNKFGIVLLHFYFSENMDIKHYKVQYKFGQYKLGSISSICDFVKKDKTYTVVWYKVMFYFATKPLHAFCLKS